MESVIKLKNHNCVFGLTLTLDELLDPIEEWEIEDFPHQFASDEEIVAQVQREQAANHAEAIEVDSDSDDEEISADLRIRETINLCEQLEKTSLCSDVDCSLEVLQILQCFWAQLQWKELQNAKQTTLTSLWGMVKD